MPPLLPPRRSMKSPIQPDMFGFAKKIIEVDRLSEKFNEEITIVQDVLTQLQNLKLKQGPQGIQGMRGPVGQDGADGKDGKNVVLADVQAEIQKLFTQPTINAEEIALVIFGMEKFKTFIKENLKQEDTEEEEIDQETIVSAVLDELTKRGIDMGKIEARLAEIRNHTATFGAAMHGGGDTVAAGSGVTITHDAAGNKVITASPVAVAWKTPTPTPDGVITAFTVLSQPVDVVADGIAMYDGAGYTYAALTITFTNPPTQYVRYR